MSRRESQQGNRHISVSLTFSSEGDIGGGNLEGLRFLSQRQEASEHLCVLIGLWMVQGESYGWEARMGPKRQVKDRDRKKLDPSWGVELLVEAWRTLFPVTVTSSWPQNFWATPSHSFTLWLSNLFLDSNHWHIPSALKSLRILCK